MDEYVYDSLDMTQHCFEEKVKVRTYCAEVTVGYLDTVTAEMLSVQSGLLSLVHHCQLYGWSHFFAVAR